MSVIHIYGQNAHHDPVWIVGNTEALTDLREAIDRAISHQDSFGVVENTKTADGEGYDIVVVEGVEDWQDETWVKLVAPYTADYAKDNADDRIGPIDVVPDKEALMRALRGEDSVRTE